MAAERERVLVVDDDRSFRVLARDLLERTIARAPDASPAIWGLLSSARAALGDWEGAESARRRASELDGAP